MKKIEICENLGFCHGVRDAIWSSVLFSESSKRVFVLGNLIHNGRVLTELSLSKIQFIKEVEELPKGARVIIPAHGITKEVFEKLKKKTDEIIDMTCPVVMRLRKSLIDFSQRGYSIVLFGKKNHPEIVGAVSFIERDNVTVIENIDEVKESESILKANKVVFLSQTTANYEKFIEISDYLKTLFLNELMIYNTICPTVTNRQRNTLNLSKKADSMIIVGDKRSSNTRSLFDISSKNSYSLLLESDKPFLIESEFEEKLKNSELIGITAGTSTPFYVVEEFLKSIKERFENITLPSVIVIYGPTASGKTEISEELALKFNGEIVSCDSMQIYKDLNIGTAKPSLFKGITYHLVDFLDLSAQFSVAEYRKLANNAIQEILKKKKIPIIVGGSYLYLSSIIDGLFEIEKSFDESVKKELLEAVDSKGLDSLYEELCRVDPEAAEKINRNDLKRIVRALEVYKVTGEKISYLRKEKTFPLPYFYIKIGLVRPVSELYERIDKRVDKMIQGGLISEVKRLLQDGFDRDLERIKPHGYREIVDFLRGETSLEEACYLMKKNTRNYAKRQLSWLRQRSDFHILNLSPKSIEESVNSVIEIVETSKEMSSLKR
jgi:tRNA dimethylallyltransferase